MGGVLMRGMIMMTGLLVLVLVYAWIGVRGRV